MTIRTAAVFCFLYLLALAPLSCQSADKGPALLPQPRQFLPGKGQFLLTPQTRLLYPEDQADWELPARALQNATGLSLPLQAYRPEGTVPENNRIYLVPDEEIGYAEAYRLEVRPERIVIRAATAAGAFYAIQTLRQLLPPAIQPGRNEWPVPACVVEDAPRFRYRGLHLDVSRHFFPVPVVKRYIDLLAFHKMNTFHWHLTDDQGWRIDIRQYPELRTSASCRQQTLVGHYGDVPERYDGQAHCGRYTQEEIREVLAYARERFVTVVPEIELPGHAQAALAAFPELGCTGGPYEVMTTWGVSQEVFCAGNEKTFEFWEHVLDEVCALFPGPYVHIGGDECPKDRWKSCLKCQERIRKEGLKDEHELQSYCIRRVEKMLAARGKKLIGWDEILEGGLAPNATVMSWRGIQGGVEAARQAHEVIMTPTDNCYLDYYQGDPETEPLAIGGFLPLQQVYGYEPVPAELNAPEARYIIGVQANVWTEYIATPDYLEYMVYPRACALAEVAWTAKDQRQWDHFAARLPRHLERLDALGVRYSNAFFEVKSAFKDGKIELSSADPEVDILYTLDGSDPKPGASRYHQPFTLHRSAVLKAAAFRNGRQLGNTTSREYLIHLAFGKPYTLGRQPERYNGGETYALTNGIQGQLKKWTDWVGLTNRDIDPVIDLQSETRLQAVRLNYVAAANSWIYPPREVQVWLSDDGQNFRQVAAQTVQAPATEGKTIGTVVLKFKKTKARYVKVLASTLGIIPEGAPGAGNGAWLFVDEVVVE
jgi:hexosaminidase